MIARLFGLAVCAALVASPALAQETTGFYASLGYAGEGVSDIDAEFGSIQGRLGYRLHRHFGVEGELGHGVNSDTPQFADVDLEGQAAAYLMGYLPVGPKIDLFARVGVGAQDMEGENFCIAWLVAPGPSICNLPFAEESVNYGLGATYMFDARNGLRADWTRKDYGDADLKADAWSIAFQRRF